MTETIARIRGRKLQEIRTHYFQVQPLCQCSDRKCPHHVYEATTSWMGEDGILHRKVEKFDPPYHCVAATILDHIKPLHQGGTNDESNYQGLCEACHDWKTTTERGNKSKPYAAQGLDWV